MTKTILLDIDGVLLRWSTRFSQKYAEEHNIPYEEISAFFKSEFEECSIGKKDLKQSLPPYLTQWNWQGSVDDFLTYWFENQMDTDHELLSEIQTLREKGIKVYLASNQEIYRTDYLRGLLEFNKNFDGEFMSCQFGMRKENPEFFTKILDSLKINADSILYFDDDERNINAASTLGIHGIVYRNITDFKEATKNL